MMRKCVVIHPREYCDSENLKFYEFQYPQIDLVVSVPIVTKPSVITVGRSYVFCAELRDVQVLGLDSIVVTKSNKILLHHLSSWHYDSVGILRTIAAKIEDNDIYLDIDDDAQFIEEECIYTGGAETPNFGHLFWQGLSRIAVANENKDLSRLPLAVPDNVPSRWFEFYERLGYDRTRRIPFNVSKPVRFRKLWMPSLPFYRGNISDRIPYYWDKAIWFMRDRLMKDLTNSREGLPKRLFIARKNAAKRRLINHEQVWDLLSKHSFYDFDPYNHTTEEQLKMLSTAEIIVITGGASSCVPLVSAPNCLFVELLPKGVVGFFGAPVYTCVTRQPLERIFGEPSFLPDNPSLDLAAEDPLHLRDRDYSIPIEKLSQIISAAVEIAEHQNPIDISTSVQPGLRKIQ